MNYAYEVRSIDKVVELQKLPKVTPQELSLAKQLISSLMHKTFDIEQFKDTYAEKLKRLIKKRAKGEVVKVVENKPLRRAKAKKKTLITALKESLAEASQPIAQS